MASREAKLSTVMALFDAFGELDAEAFVSHLTEDVIMRPSAFVTGESEYRGHREVVESFDVIAKDLEREGKTLHLRPHALYVDRDDEDRVLALGELTIIRDGGEPFGTEVAYLHRMSGDKVAEVWTWLDHEEGLRQLAAPEEVKLPRGGRLRRG